MSIPPLVCSTPPPPDQCEDDRDIEDFDIHYNLSQDDEDDGNGYNYGTYSDYIYPNTTSANIQDKWLPDISKKAETKLSNDLLDKKSDDSLSILPENSSVNKCEFEDIVIEDLNLKVEDQIDTATSEKGIDKYGIETSRFDCSSKEVDTSMLVTAGSNVDLEVQVPIGTEDLVEANLVNNDEKMFEENILPYMEANINTEVQAPIHMDNVVMKIENIPIDSPYLNDTEPCTMNNSSLLNSELDQKAGHALESMPDQENPIDLESNLNSNINDINTLESKVDFVDDFGDFDDFQFIASENDPAATIEDCDNPWNSEIPEDCKFGDFTANFDVEDNNLHSHNKEGIQNKPEFPEGTSVDDSDDFGDFDDFKSSSNDHNEDILIKNGEISQSVPVLSLHSPDSEVQIIESINSVISTIFTSDIPEIQNEFEIKLDSVLNETWGHLVDTDIRQPYIVNWNNSIGQKSLLKALCIDSRNILFGPKWNNGMPKYAANLTVAPLQPQKPFVPTNAVNADDQQHVEKNTSKETGNWTDPFTSDGQEYTYAEALLLDLEHLMATLDQMAHKHSSFKISDLLTHACNTESGTSGTSAITRPANLDVFTKVMPQEMDKIYSSTLSVQPIRQINLPDTHIFTPTDSETPRSKTIHYDRGSSVLAPQSSEDNNKTDEVTVQPKSDGGVNKLETDEDYWEFQDFKGPVENKCANPEIHVADKSNASSTNNSTLLTSTSYEAQILQPVKIEPLLPTLNWPAPGEVKETFDDFSDFISSSPWNENVNTVNQTDIQLTSKQDCEMPKTETLDDDFETFQSAPPLTSIAAPTEIISDIPVNISHHNFNAFPQNFNDINDISHSMHSKLDSFTSFDAKESFVQNQTPITTTNIPSTIKDTNINTSPVMSSGIHSSTLLQPSIAGPSGSQRSHKKTGQILQPLSLESYSQINWPNPGIDLQDLSRFNPVESLQSLKSDASTGGSSKLSSPAHKNVNNTRNETPDDDIWGDFVSSKPKQQSQAKKTPAFADDDEWTDFVSSPSVKPQNGLNTISLNVHTNLNMQKSSSQTISLDIPTLNYVTPKSSSRGMYNEQHFQNL